LPESARGAAAARRPSATTRAAGSSPCTWPSFLPVMMYADNRELRRQIYEPRRRAPANSPACRPVDTGAIVAADSRAARREGEVLGFPNYAPVPSPPSMAEVTDEVLGSCGSLAARLRPAAQQELASYVLSRERFGLAAIEAWDIPITPKSCARNACLLREDLRPYSRVAGSGRHV